MRLKSSNILRVIGTLLIFPMICTGEESNWMTPSMYQVMYNFIASIITLGIIVIATLVSIIQLLITQPSNLSDM